MPEHTDFKGALYEIGSNSIANVETDEPAERSLKVQTTAESAERVKCVYLRGEPEGECYAHN